MNALGFASDRAVRVILTALCDDSDVCTKALKYLAKIEPRAVHAAMLFPQVKRKATSGELEPDYDSDFWADHDENCHGIIDSDFCRKEYPDGFLWTCCDESGTEPGCKFSRHQSDPEQSKRHRGDDTSSESSTAEESDGGDDNTSDDVSEGQEEEDVEEEDDDGEEEDDDGEEEDEEEK